MGNGRDRSFGASALIRKLFLNTFCRVLWGALWNKTLFVVGTCALIVAAANSEINLAAVEAATYGPRIRCDGPGVTYFPQARLLVLDEMPYRFRPEDVSGRLPTRVVLSDGFTGDAFVIRARGSSIESNRYTIDRVSDPNFKPRNLDCTSFKEVM